MTTKEKSNSALTIHEWANIHNIASSHFRTSSLHGIREELRAPIPELAAEAAADGDSGDEPQLAMARDVSPETSRFPTYQTLFAETEGTAPVDHDSSILSPAAYFVDLKRLIEAKITNANQNAGKIPAGLSLHDRRPDLREIELDAKNITTEVPYLEIVNEVMAKKMKTDSGKEPLQQLATSIYPFNLPYNAPLEQIRTCLAHFGVELTDIYKTFGLSEKNDAWVAEALGMSPFELTHIRSSEVGELSWEDLAQVYGLP